MFKVVRLYENDALDAHPHLTRLQLHSYLEAFGITSNASMSTALKKANATETKASQHHSTLLRDLGLVAPRGNCIVLVRAADVVKALRLLNLNVEFITAFERCIVKAPRCVFLTLGMTRRWSLTSEPKRNYRYGS